MNDFDTPRTTTVGLADRGVDPTIKKGQMNPNTCGRSLAGSERDANVDDLDSLPQRKFGKTTALGYYGPREEG